MVRVFQFLGWISITLLCVGCSARSVQPLASLSPPLERVSPLKVDVEELFTSHRSIRIAIDPGHGGKDPGTQSLDTPKYQEKYLTLVTSMMLEKHLKRLGYSPFLTRDRDVFIDLYKRVEIAEEEQADLLVSIHYNAAPNRSAHGVEVYYYSKGASSAKKVDSERLANQVLDSVVEQTEARKRGVRHGNFAVIREPKMPAVLVEGGFVTNRDEMRALADPDYLNRVAWGVAQGIDDFLSDRGK